MEKNKYVHCDPHGSMDHAGFLLWCQPLIRAGFAKRSLSLVAVFLDKGVEKRYSQDTPRGYMKDLLNECLCQIAEGGIVADILTARE